MLRLSRPLNLSVSTPVAPISSVLHLWIWQSVAPLHVAGLKGNSMLLGYALRAVRGRPFGAMDMQSMQF